MRGNNQKSDTTDLKPTADLNVWFLMLHTVLLKTMNRKDYWFNSWSINCWWFSLILLDKSTVLILLESLILTEIRVGP